MLQVWSEKIPYTVLNPNNGQGIVMTNAELRSFFKCFQENHQNWEVTSMQIVPVLFKSLRIGEGAVLSHYEMVVTYRGKNTAPQNTLDVNVVYGETNEQSNIN